MWEAAGRAVAKVQGSTGDSDTPGREAEEVSR
jgi:hypothetical protein